MQSRRGGRGGSTRTLAALRRAGLPEGRRQALRFQARHPSSARVHGAAWCRDEECGPERTQEFPGRVLTGRVMRAPASASAARGGRRAAGRRAGGNDGRVPEREGAAGAAHTRSEGRRREGGAAARAAARGIGDAGARAGPQQQAVLREEKAAAAPSALPGEAVWPAPLDEGSRRGCVGARPGPSLRRCRPAPPGGCRPSV